jgi:hypothetical protein
LRVPGLGFIVIVVALGSRRSMVKRLAGGYWYRRAWAVLSVRQQGYG